jgi:hypothetical protein
MKIRFVAALAFALTLAGIAPAQDAGSISPVGQNGGGNSNGYGAGSARRGGRGSFGGMGMMGRGLMGTVTEVAADHYTVKTDAGEVYTVHFSANTRIFKMPARMRSESGGQNGGQSAEQAQGADGGQERGMGRGMGWGGNPPEPIKASDIKVGDVVEARGETDATARSVGAVAIVQLDPQQVKQIREMEANYGKTWLMGKVTSVDGVKVSLTGAVDNAPHSFVADENTTFRRRRDPITLADIQVGDTLRVDGAVKDGVFTATAVGDIGAMQGGDSRGPRN